MDCLFCIAPGTATAFESDSTIEAAHLTKCCGYQWKGGFRPSPEQPRKGVTMKKILLIALLTCGVAFVPAQRSDAQVSVGIGFGYPGYGYRYYPYGYGYGYYPYRYYRPYRYYGYYNRGPYYRTPRYYRHHRHHHN